MKRPIQILFALLAVVFGATLLTFALQDRDRASAPPAPPSGPSAEMMGAMHRMHDAANKVAMTGDIDKDFAALMVPHHRSAVEMARVYLKHGKDPELRRLSENVIASQQAEIRQLQGGDPVSVAGPHPGH